MDEQGLLSYVKKVIHSLIVSTPERVTVERLKRDYANEEGTAVPFKRLGFKDIESFLHSIPDTVVLAGYGPMAQVFARRHAKTAHIQNLVQCQRRPSNRSRSRKPVKPNYGYPSQRSDLVFVNEPQHSNNKRINNNQSSNNYGNHSSNRQSRSSARSNSSYKHVESQAQGRASAGAQRNLARETNRMINSFQNVTIAHVDEDSSSEENHLEIYVEQGEIEVNSNKAPVLDKQAVAEKPKERHKEYLSTDEGCDEDAIPAYAVDERVLNYKYTNDASCVNLVKVEPSVTANTRPSWEEPYIEYISSDDGSESDAIPVFAVDERVMSVEYPKEAVRFDHRLPKRDVHKKFKLDDRIEVQLVTVASPHNFNFWLHDEEYEAYKNMSENMQRFYSNVHELKYTIPLYLIMIGHLGALHFRGTLWQRVEVLNIKTGNRKNIEVELVDTGERLWICHSDLKYLCKEFAHLPPQYWPGRLACVTPRQGPSFSVEASNYFFDIVSYRRLYAKIEKINDADDTITLILVDPDAAAHTKNINVALIESGWVRRCYKP
ncbi:uncharacterized protein tej [Drosophila virilis]|uniref:Uncharacterized protein, isoform B n=1 Tax=Drosophila virilis TaxID=7244 RepID=B4LMV9_DROVI|nr:uncharacterized protein LOC6626930 [Drosophila virilis]EDW62074.2 uncharacterized protein Dvir_GJ19957, isoform B [Drosophila virilis]